MKEIWVFLFLLGILFFDWPVLEIASSSLHYYLFAAWCVFIVIVFFGATISSRKGRKNV